MAKEKRVGSLGPGNAFRNWLMDVLGRRIDDRNCPVNVYKIKPSSHTVCRYEFPNQGFSVVAKFYGKPTGWIKNYDPVHALENEFNILKFIKVHDPDVILFPYADTWVPIIAKKAKKGSTLSPHSDAAVFSSPWPQSPIGATSRSTTRIVPRFQRASSRLDCFSFSS